MNGIMLQAFEWELPSGAGHWRKLRKMARKLSRDGVTAIWLPPAYKGAGGKNDVGYGVYDLYDLGEFDQKGSVETKYGSKEEYIKMVAALNRAGIQTLGDVVFNHRMGGDEKETVAVHWVDPADRRMVSEETEEGELYTRFTFPGRKGRYSDFVWDHSCFTGVDYNERDREHSLFLIDGKSWAQDVDAENGNFDYLMGNDVDVSDPRVAGELTKWGEWYLKTSGLRGFRLDAVKHISAAFLKNWLAALREKTGREIYAVGEYWHSDAEVLVDYLERTGNAMNLFDVPLHFHFHRISHGNGMYDMRTLFDGTLVSTRAMQAVTFVDNHDTQPGQSLESWVDGWFKAAAYALILLRKDGYPCVFWGDLYGIPSRGIGKVTELETLMRLRRECAYGDQCDYFDHENIVGFTRQGIKSRPGSGLAVLLSDGAGGEKRMCVGKHFAGRVFRCCVGGQKDVRVDREGYAVFAVSGGGVSVYAPKASLVTSALRRLSGRRL